MTWSRQRERGSPALARAGLAVLLRLGPAVMPVLAWPAAAWFLLTAPRARRASRQFLGRATGRPATVRAVARHFHAFARAVGDRALLLAGRTESFDIETSGVDHLLATLARGRGCILLGAHLGSFEVLRSVARHSPVPVWALMYRRNAGSLAPLLDQLAPELAARVLEIGDTASMIQAKECIERGEIVGILADRAPAGHRTVAAPFLGSPAPFPSGPFVLAATLGAPVVLFHGLRTGPRRYRVEFHAFADRVTLRRGHREDDLRATVARYAAALEPACRAHPLQWFNFFPFWETAPDASNPTALPSRAAAPPAGLPSPGLR